MFYKVLVFYIFSINGINKNKSAKFHLGFLKDTNSDRHYVRDCSFLKLLNVIHTTDEILL